jgi:hypothetical protein
MYLTQYNYGKKIVSQRLLPLTDDAAADATAPATTNPAQPYNVGCPSNPVPLGIKLQMA